MFAARADYEHSRDRRAWHLERLQTIRENTALLMELIAQIEQQATKLAAVALLLKEHARPATDEIVIPRAELAARGIDESWFGQTATIDDDELH
jgi:hypothetical protein